jgi:hypothetical protein
MNQHLGAIVLVATAELVSAQDLTEPPIDRDPLFVDKIIRATRQGSDSALENARSFVRTAGFACIPRENDIFVSDVGRADFSYVPANLRHRESRSRYTITDVSIYARR